MLAKSEMPVSLEKGVRLEFQKARDAFKPMTSWRNVSTVISSNASTEKMVMYGETAPLSEFKSERKPSKFAEYSYVITNKKYEKTITIDRDLIEDDQAGQIKMKATQMGMGYERDLDSLILGHLASGRSTLCYDGQYFFDTDHSELESGTQSNKLGVSLLDETTVQLAMQQFAGFKNDRGQNYGGRLTHVVVRRGSANAKKARELSNSLYTVESNKGMDNYFKGLFNVIEVDFGLTFNDWMAIDASSGILPVVITDRTGIENPEIVAMEADSQNGFYRDEWAYGLRVRFGLGYADWRTAILFPAV